MSTAMKLVALVALLAAAIAPAQAQTCQEGALCKALGGECDVPNSANTCVNTFLWFDLCAAGDNCQCCFPRDCRPTERCEAFDGKCVKREQCTKPTQVWVEQLCDSHPFRQQRCGCCLERPPVKCEQSTVCTSQGGECMPKEECPLSSTGSYSWKPALCAPFSGSGKKKCGCCIKEPTPPPTPSPTKKCKQTKKCKKNGGLCIDEEACTGNRVWDTELCNNPTFPGSPKRCGCCHPPKPPTCEQTDECTEAGGRCMKRERCADLQGQHFWKPKLCVKPDGTEVEDCGCCIPVDDPEPCEDTEACKEAGGRCMKRLECGILKGAHFWKPKLCVKPDGTELEDCGCCIPKDPVPCEQSDECKEAGGLCIDEEACTGNRVWDTELCKNPVIAGVPKRCGCCHPPKPPTCEQTDECTEAGGRCMKRERCADLPGQHFWKPKLCTKSDGTEVEDCGCCIPEDDPEPCEDTDECEAAGGRCIKRERCANLAGQHLWNPNLCKPTDNDEECGCCIPEDEPEPCVQTEECADKSGKCLSKSQCADLGMQNWDPELCQNTAAGGPLCGCCFNN